jgi:membrane associated rhomboid family serine protease
MQIATSPVSIIIFFLTIAVSLYAWYGKSNIYDNWALSPWEFIHNNKWYLVITKGFIHADFMHLIFNMMTYYFFAFRLEETVGSFAFFIIYFGSLVLSDISTIIKNRNNSGYRAVGASGAIAGIIFSYVLFDPTSKLMIFLIPIGIPAPIFALLYLAYCYYASRKSYDQINHEAHFWGALTGLAITIILFPDVVPYFIHKIF